MPSANDLLKKLVGAYGCMAVLWLYASVISGSFVLDRWQGLDSGHGSPQENGLFLALDLVSCLFAARRFFQTVGEAWQWAAIGADESRRQRGKPLSLEGWQPPPVPPSKRRPDPPPRCP